MRHGRRTDFTSLNLLLEVIHTHVGPNVATQVDEDIVYTFEGIELRGDIVVVFNLGCRVAAL